MAEYFPTKTITTILGDFQLQETVPYSNGGYSEFYSKDSIVLIIDFDICKLPKNNEIFEYFLLTEKQNFYINNFSHVFRFLSEDITMINSTLEKLNDFKIDNYFLKTHRTNRSLTDSSPLEFSFEQNFTQVYGMQSLKYLFKEYEICDTNGSSFYLDYLVKTKTWTKAVEENGISYHHPQIIRQEKYRLQLHKQNTCSLWNIKLYRFSTEDCKFCERIQDDIKSFFGTDSSVFIENALTATRTFKLYEHQELTLKDIKTCRENGIKSFLVVFPTGTGKSKIIEEDIKNFAQEHQQNPSKNHDFSSLILVPNNAIYDDWQKRIKNSLSSLSDKIVVKTYSYMVRHFMEESATKYNYIVVDEAHHAVAEMLKKVILHYTPDFLIGLTATDQRPDKKKLEDIFGSYTTNLSLEDAMKKKLVAQAHVYRIETNLDLSNVRINGKDFINADLEKSFRVSSRNELIANVIKTYFCDGIYKELQGVIFCININHANEMARILQDYGISAASLVSKSSKTKKNKTPEQTMSDFQNKKIRFLCSCQMINEGWDYPELGILIMARPTLSKVLYLQQIGRGLRKTTSKKKVFIIDVVDQYGSMALPWSMHSLFNCPLYTPFGNILNRNYKVGDFLEIEGLVEQITRISRVDTTTFEEKYHDYLSQEQLAREYFVSTDTITSWLKKGKVQSNVVFPFGSRKIYMFSPENVEATRQKLGIKKHTDETIKQDFFDFLAERDYSLSYKMPFLLAFINNMDKIGDAKISDILLYYIRFYQQRIADNLLVDKKNCPYTKIFLENEKEVQKNMLTNPFEKFERKRFMYYSSELGVISLNHALFSKLTEADFKNIQNQMHEDLANYYNSIGSFYKRTDEYIFPSEKPLRVADSKQPS